MKKTIIAAALALLFGAHSASAFGIFDNLNYQARLGYNIGGTMPMGMPASIRGLDSYKPRPSFTLALDAYKPLTKKWGMMAGFHFQTKAMETDARVKSYSMEMRQGGESLSGLFTGNVVTKTSQLVVTLPLQATFNVSDAVRLKFGPYFSYALNNDFSGYAYDGYLREGDPTGQKVELGHNEGERGDYDFSSDMRHWHFGFDFGADWYFSHRFGAYADVQWGMSGVFRKEFKIIEQTMYPVYATLGVMYKLK